MEVIFEDGSKGFATTQEDLDRIKKIAEKEIKENNKDPLRKKLDIIFNRNEDRETKVEIDIDDSISHMTLKEFLYSYEDGNLFMIDGEDDGIYCIDSMIREAFEDRWNDKIKSFRIEDGYYNDPLFGECEKSYLVLYMVKEFLQICCGLF